MRYTKDQALKRVQQEQKQKEARKQSRKEDMKLLDKYKQDFYLVRNRFRAEKGKATKIIILDKSTKDFEYVFEHQLWDNATKTGSFELCHSEEKYECPLCKAATANPDKFNKSYFRAGFTIMYIYKDADDGNKTKVQKAFMSVKSNQMDSFLSVMNEAEEKHGTVRGLSFKVFRKDADMQPASGIPYLEGTSIKTEMFSEDKLKQIQKKYQPTEITKTYDDGTVRVTHPKNWLTTPIRDFEGIHLNTDINILNKKYDPDYVEGSTVDEFPSDDGFDFDDESKIEEGSVDDLELDSVSEVVETPKPKPTRRTKKSKEVVKEEPKDDLLNDLESDLADEEDSAGAEIEELIL